MNKIFLATGIAALAVAAVSCDSYDIYPEEYAKVVMIKDSGERYVTVYPTDTYSPVDIVVMKGGHTPEASAPIRLEVMDDAAWEAYDAETGRGFLWTPLPDSCYTFASAQDGVAAAALTNSVDYTFTGESDRYHQFSLNLIPGAIANWMTDNNVTETTLESGETVLVTSDGKYPVIGVNLVSDDEATSINSEGTQLLIRPLVQKATLDYYTATSGDASNIISRIYSLSEVARAETYAPTLGLSIPCSNNWGFTVNLRQNTTRSTYVTYASEQGLDVNDMVVMPTDMFSFTGENVTFTSGDDRWNLAVHMPQGVQQVDLGLNIDVTKIDIEHDINKVYYLAFTMLTALEWDDENNTTDQIQFSTNSAISTGAARTFFVTVSAQSLLPLIELDGSEVTANDCEPSEGSIGGLFDEDTSTFFHSTWSTDATHDATYGSYLEFDLTSFTKTGVTKCFFIATPRGGSNVQGFPTLVQVYGSEDGATWTTFTHADAANGKLTVTPPDSGELNIGTQSSPFTSETPAKYLRFCVLTSKAGSLTSSGSAYWNLSELRLYAD